VPDVNRRRRKMMINGKGGQDGDTVTMSDHALIHCINYTIKYQSPICSSNYQPTIANINPQYLVVASVVAIANS